jgi:hypothetical protein
MVTIVTMAMVVTLIVRMFLGMRVQMSMGVSMTMAMVMSRMPMVSKACHPNQIDCQPKGTNHEEFRQTLRLSSFCQSFRCLDENLDTYEPSKH